MIFNTNKKTAVIIFLAVFLYVIDRFFKYFAHFKQNADLQIIPGLLDFSFAKNYFIAFSLPFSGLFLIIFILLILIFLIFYIATLIYKKSYIEASLLFLVVLGAVSNLLDRFKFGYVVDYFDMKYFTVFNVADIMIVCGIVCFILLSWKNEKKTEN